MWFPPGIIIEGAGKAPFLPMRMIDDNTLKVTREFPVAVRVAVPFMLAARTSRIRN